MLLNAAGIERLEEDDDVVNVYTAMKDEAEEE